MKYTIDALPTCYGGFEFRSQLEATWAAFFDLCGWIWEYEPVRVGDGGRPWIPDFILSHGGKRRVLIEVKPFDMFSHPVADIRKEMERMRSACAPLRHMSPFHEMADEIEAVRIPVYRTALLGNSPWQNEIGEWLLGITQDDDLVLHRCVLRKMDFAPSASINHWLCNRPTRQTVKRIPDVDALWENAKQRARHERMGDDARDGREEGEFQHPIGLLRLRASLDAMNRSNPPGSG